ncbi:MAG: amidohydrolase [Spirochaetaceae bacterium]|jgi:amidohydrolase|nr:amidohydrolase [Spirochaetaceae bacterium]
MFTDEITQAIARHYPQGAAIRQKLHQYPELSEQEWETAKLVATTLREYGIETQEGIAGTGVLGIIRGNVAGKTVLLRADMDALAIQEAAPVPYASKRPGIMHACGHDGHTAGLLIAGMALMDLKDRIPGTIKLMFQPAEETVGGAARMIQSGVLENPRVDAALGCHLWGQAPQGTVWVKSGPVMAAPDEFRITLIGRGGHGGLPHLGVDPIVMAAQVIQQFQTIVSRRRNPLDPAVVSIGMIHGGETHNVIPAEVHLVGTIRTLSAELRDFIPQEMDRILQGLTLAAGGSYTLEVCKRYPPLVNDPAVTEVIREAAKKILPSDRVQDAPEANMGGEDFAYIAEQVPSSFFFVGITPDEKPLIHHSPYFQWDDSVLRISAACLCQGAVDVLLRP